MSTILELWDIHGHNARIINDKIQGSFILWTSATQSPNSFICILDIIFTDPVNLK